MPSDVLEADEIRTLADIGFMALMRGAHQEAAAIFAGVSAIRPDEDAAHIGKALLMLHQGQVVAAIAALRARPPSDGIRVILGMALLRHGDLDEARDILSDIVETARDEQVIAMAKDLLSEMTKPGGLPTLR